MYRFTNPKLAALKLLPFQFGIIPKWISLDPAFSITTLYLPEAWGSSKVPLPPSLQDLSHLLRVLVTPSYPRSSDVSWVLPTAT